MRGPTNVVGPQGGEAVPLFNQTNLMFARRNARTLAKRECCVTKRERLREEPHSLGGVRANRRAGYIAGALPLYKRLRISSTSARSRESLLMSSAIFSQPCSTVV